MGDGIQITIPDFDEDDYSSTPVFGRSQNASLWGSSSSGQDSPTILTPLASERADRSYFHARGDSVTSDDSTSSIQYSTRKVKSPFAHAQQSSFTTSMATGSSFSKKTSFASLRNAFKKTIDPAPPVPPLDPQAYPALKNPFSRSTSSLAHRPATPHKHQTSVHASPPHFRPSTPASADSRTRGTPNRVREHAYARSQHSHSGSIFYASDGGSDYGQHFASSSPPPVPRMPFAAGASTHDDSRSLSDSEDKVNMDPRTPSDYALHAIFIRFAATAEHHIEEFIRQPLERDPSLIDYMGPGVDTKFDELLLSLGKIAQKHAKQVVDSLLRWRKTQYDDVGGEMLQYHISTSTRVARPQEVASTLNERKSLASIYIVCRALIAATRSISKDGMSEPLGHNLEQITFEQFQKMDIKMLTSSANHRTNADLCATLLGQIANVRFESVTDRFLVEFGPVAAGQVPKDADFKYENLVKGLKHIQIKVWPPESFEEGAEFMASLSKSFENAHGNRLKTAFAETLVYVLHPIAKTAQAEVNHPEWAKAMEIIFPRARDMMAKPRYWHVAYPLAVTSLCVAPQEVFLRHWLTCFEAGLGKLKERMNRIPVLNGMLRLLWTYLYRCHETASTSAMKLESLVKHFFPSNRLAINPSEEQLEPLVYMVHYILSRHFDFGSELCLELLQERSITSANGNITTHLAPERMTIATHAILLTLHAIEREEPTPTWPSSSDFTAPPPATDYPSSSAFVPPTLLSKPGWRDLMDRSSFCLKLIAIACYQAVGQWSILDDQWSAARLNPNYEDAHNFAIRRHPEGNVAYPLQSAPQIRVLQMVYQSWPRCLHPTLPLVDTFNMLIRGTAHVEPTFAEAATQALHRFMADSAHGSTLLSRFALVLFDSSPMSAEDAGLRLAVECSRMLTTWITFVGQWVQAIIQKPTETLSQDEQEEIFARIDEIEAGSLFLLTHVKRSVGSVGVKAIRLLVTLQTRVASITNRHPTSFRLLDVFNGKIAPITYLSGHDDVLEAEELVRLEQWKQSSHTDIALRIAESDNVIDRSLWRYVYPAFLHACMEHTIPVLPAFREKAVAAASRYHQYMVQLSGVNNRTPPNLPQRSGSGEKDTSKLVNDNRHVVHQWHLWMKTICATAQVSEGRNLAMREHSRARSEGDQMSTARDLFKYLSQFLESDHTLFRDVAVSCISSFPAHAYSQLLEDLNMLSSRQFDGDARTKLGNAPLVGRARRQERFHTAMARIYYLTAHLLQDQRSSSKQTALVHIIKYIRNMQTFLMAPEHRDLFSLQRLRRYFCGTLERLFDGLAALNDSDRFIPPNMHLSLYRMCEEWCQLGKQSEEVTKRLVVMQTAAGKSLSDPSEQAEIIKRFQTETRALSNAAVGAMAALCHKAFFPPEQSSASPIDRAASENLQKPMHPSQTLDRLTAVLASFHEPVQIAGRKALRSLLLHAPVDSAFLDEALRKAFVTSRELDTSNVRFFEVVADVVSSTPTAHGFTFSQVVCLALSNLCHSALEVRRQAFKMLETIHEQHSGIISLVQYEAAVYSSSPSAYLHAHRLVSGALAGEHPDKAINVLAYFAGWIPRICDGNSDRSALLLLQSLEYWVPSINLMESGSDTISREGRAAIYHLMALTSRYSESHAEQVLVLWTRLVDAPYQSNGYAVMRYLLEQAPKVSSIGYYNCCAKVIACFSQSIVGNHVFSEICNLIEPDRILPTYEHKMAPPDPEEMEEWSDLDILFSDQPKLTLGMAQHAFIFLSEVTMERYWDVFKRTHALLHVLVLHLNSRQPYLKQRSRQLLFQLLRFCISGYDEVVDRSSSPSRSELSSIILKMEHELADNIWAEDDAGMQADARMKSLTSQILALVEPLYPELRAHWGSFALEWGTKCLKREMAFRSLQLYRALSPPVTQHDLKALLDRLANTVADDDRDIQNFSVEILRTLVTMVSSSELDASLLSKLFWGAVACLSTTVEVEFLHVLQFFEVLLTRVDLNDPSTVDALMERKPPNWHGPSSIQSRLLTGLRSSSTSGLIIKLLQSLTTIDDARLIDPSEGRVRDLYTLSLPWCLHAMTAGLHDETFQEFALNIGRLAEEEERPSISRIMTSFAKGRFRTKEDFLRESVASLREHYGADHWANVITLLMGLVLNQERWLRIHTMQILKVLFQQRETRKPVDLLGSELLMPLLRLLETDLASQALDVLDEPMQISGGPAAKHVLRMSLYHHLRADKKEMESVAEVFGIAQESGWCVPRSSTLQTICRSNLLAICDSTRSSVRPLRINFQPDENSVVLDEQVDDDLGDMVQNLHELSSFFQDEGTLHPAHHRQLEARVAEILAKSSDLSTDIPPTPFSGVFNIKNSVDFDDSDESDYDSAGSDLFEFDSLPITHYASNNSHHH